MRYAKVSMQRRRATVHFGFIRVVVPWADDSATVDDLAQAAILRYKRATGKMESDVRVKHLKCISDDAILDPDDRLIDVFDETTDQIVAILDDDSSNNIEVSMRPAMSTSGCSHQQILSPASTTSFNVTHSPSISSHSPPVGTAGNWHYGSASPVPRMTSSTSLDFQRKREHFQSTAIPSTSSGSSIGKSPLTRVRDSVVEITSNKTKTDNGLRVLDSHSLNSATSSCASPQRSSMRSTDTSDSVDKQGPKSHHRVTMSPEVEKRLAKSEERESRLFRTSARKSRISESFYDALDRMGERHSVIQTSLKENSRYRPHDQSPNCTIVEFVGNDDMPMGIEVSGVKDLESSMNSQNQKLQAVEIIRIDPEGRVARDGQLRVGDNIIEIDGRPVYQMSVLRARAYLSDLGLKQFPRLTIARPVSSFGKEDNDPSEDVTSSSQKKPILSALQQANTQAIGETTLVSLSKSTTGFGFTVTGRETAKGERLFYIGTVKPNGPALGYLKAGDKLLEVNGEGTGEMTQGEVVDRLKKANIGETVTFLVSRVSAVLSATTAPDEASTSSDTRDVTKADLKSDSKLNECESCGNEEIEFLIPLNNTGSAGLGLCLKARVTVRSDKSREDCGIFIKSVLNGGAAYKDGRLRVDDRVMGIEDLRFDNLSNAVAGEAITKKLKEIGPSLGSVRIFIQRCNKAAFDQPGPSVVGLSHSLSSYRESQSTDNEKRSSVNSEIASFSRLDESELPSIDDAFDREAPTRKSLSEKRGTRSTNDPSHIKLFQDIKHKRQISAPPAPLTSSSSFHGQQKIRSASQRAAARLRSQSVHPRQPSHGILKNNSKTGPSAGGEVVDSVAAPLSIGPPMRRSMSVESINTSFFNTSTGAVSHEHRSPMVSRQQQNPDYAISPHPYPPGTSSDVIVHPRSTGGSGRDKHKRKSVGNAFRSFFGMGKSQEESPEQDELDERRRAEEERRRLNDHYGRLRQRELDANQRLPSTPNAGRRVAPNADSELQQQANMYQEYEPLYVQYVSPYASTSCSDYALLDRYRAHRYNEQTGNGLEAGNGNGRHEPSAGYPPPQSAHHHIIYEPPQQSHHYALPSAMPYHDGLPIREPNEIKGDYGFTKRSNGREKSAGPTSRSAAAVPVGHRVPAPDYYHMFNSWFAHSGGGAVAAAPAIKAMYGGVPRGSGTVVDRSDYARPVVESNVWPVNRGIAPHPRSPYYGSTANAGQQPGGPSPYYSNRFSNY